MNDEYRLDVLPNDIREIMHNWYHTWGDENSMALAKLRAKDHSRVIKSVKEILNHPDPDARCLVARVLMLIDAEATLPVILPLLSDHDYGVRLSVITDLADFGHVDERAVDPLIKTLLEDSDNNVRSISAFLLGVIGDKKAISALKWAETHDHGENYEGTPVSAIAREALKRLVQ